MASPDKADHDEFIRNLLGLSGESVSNVDSRSVEDEINRLDNIISASGRFAPKPVPPGTIPPGLFAQNFERDCSLQSSGTIRSKTNLRVDLPIFIIHMFIH